MNMSKILMILIGLGIVGSIISGIKKLIIALLIIGVLLILGMYTGVIGI